MTMPRRAATLALVACAFAAGCATRPPVARTTVVLLPDDDGAVGAVAVTTAGGTQALDRPFTATTVQTETAAPAASIALGREQVERRFAELLKAQPSRPVSFTLHFVHDKTVLTDESKALLPALLHAVRSRKPTEIIVSGHADASGSEERNAQLAAERARFVADLLRRADPALERIELQSFGDRMPLVPSRSRGAEPRNRRAEILIL